jgi:hypothetical protein
MLGTLFNVITQLEQPIEMPRFVDFDDVRAINPFTQCTWTKQIEEAMFYLDDRREDIMCK